MANKIIKSSTRLSQSELDKMYANTDYVDASQINTENASTTALCDFILETVDPDKGLSILDGGCGNGAVLQSVAKRFPKGHYVGVDLSTEMIHEAQKRIQDERYTFHCRDMLELDDVSPEGGFDISLLIHVVSMFDDFEDVLRNYINATKQHVFVNTLLSDHDVDVKITAFPANLPEQPAWNIFSLQRFEKVARALGAKNVLFRPFEMPYDLEVPKTGMGSYTVPAADGHRLTFTGPLYLPWYLIRVDL